MFICVTRSTLLCIWRCHLIDESRCAGIIPGAVCVCVLVGAKYCLVVLGADGCCISGKRHITMVRRWHFGLCWGSKEMVAVGCHECAFPPHWCVCPRLRNIVKDGSLCFRTCLVLSCWFWLVVDVFSQLCIYHIYRVGCFKTQQSSQVAIRCHTQGRFRRLLL